MTNSNVLWQANQDLSEACLQHPFVRGIADGSLAQKSFAYYVAQDAFFLEAFARAYSIAAAKAPDWEGFEILHNLGSGVLEELRLHQGYAAKWGVNLPNTKPGIATRRYTDFLLATAWGSGAGLTVAAMTPCLRLYAFLGQQLAKPKIPEHAFSDWISTYSSPEFEILAKQVESLVDRYADTGPEVEATYRYAMLCERDFFQAAWEIE
ncbi:MAG: TenA family protein [Microcoleus sp.]|uniref:TenA family protein n=1 Tax=Microcoleus sp. TaxID=44472 RepID=UPI003C79189F